MMKLRFVISMAVILAVNAVPVFAGVPFESDDAGVVDVGKVEVEYAGSYSRDRQGGVKTNSHAGELSITTGLLNKMDIGVAIPYTFQQNVEGFTNKGFGDMAVAVKYAFLETGGVNFAVSPSIVVPTGDSSEGLSDKSWHPAINFIATKNFGENAALHANLGYLHYFFRNRDDKVANRHDLATFTLAFEARIAPPLTVGIETGTSNPLEKENSTWNSFSLVGLSYAVREGFELNAGVRFGLNRGETDVTTLYGATVTF